MGFFPIVPKSFFLYVPSKLLIFSHIGAFLPKKYYLGYQCTHIFYRRQQILTTETSFPT